MQATVVRDRALAAFGGALKCLFPSSPLRPSIMDAVRNLPTPTFSALWLPRLITRQQLYSGSQVAGHAAAVQTVRLSA